MKKVKDRFVCWVPCKPYVKQYLIQNFNSPDTKWPEIVNLSQDKQLLQDFRKRLTNPCGRFDNKYSSLSRYSTTVPIEMSKDDFYRYGWALTNTEAVGFCTIVERRVKTMLCTYLDVHRSFGIPVSVAIRNFQAKFGFSEDVWPYDSIRREYNRNGLKDEEPLAAQLFQKINQIIMVNLSRNGTISQQGLKMYETNHI